VDLQSSCLWTDCILSSYDVPHLWKLDLLWLPTQRIQHLFDICIK
jgi:hypothetical protein